MSRGTEPCQFSFKSSSSGFIHLTLVECSGCRGRCLLSIFSACSLLVSRKRVINMAVTTISTLLCRLRCSSWNDSHVTRLSNMSLFKTTLTKLNILLKKTKTKSKLCRIVQICPGVSSCSLIFIQHCILLENDYLLSNCNMWSGHHWLYIVFVIGFLIHERNINIYWPDYLFFGFIS